MGRQWCRNKLPIIVVNGNHVDLTWESYEDINADVTGPTLVEVRFPPGSSHAVVNDTESFGGLGYTWNWIEDATCDITASGAKVKVRSYTPANPDALNAGEPYPIKLTGDPLDNNNGTATVNGHTNAWTGNAIVRA